MDVELEVFSLTGETLRLPAAKSSTGRELRRQIVQTLPVKKAAQVLLRHGDQRISLNKTLEDGGKNQQCFWTTWFVEQVVKVPKTCCKVCVLVEQGF